MLSAIQESTSSHACSLSPQVPNIVSFKMNATLSVSQAAPQDSLDTLSFPLFSAGQRRSRRNWVNATEELPEGLRDTYTAAQTKLLCTAQVCLPPGVLVCCSMHNLIPIQCFVSSQGQSVNTERWGIDYLLWEAHRKPSPRY